MDPSDAQRLKTLEDENRRLKKLRAEAMLDLLASKELLAKTENACGAPDGRASPGRGAATRSVVRPTPTSSANRPLPPSRQVVMIFVIWDNIVIVAWSAEADSDGELVPHSGI